MACDFPINIANPNYDKYPGEYKRLKVPCGKCVNCLKSRAKSWFVRLHYYNKIAHSAHFVTLTYDIPRRTQNNLMTLCKPDLQNYMKRLRKRENDVDGEKGIIKYYACAEYGGKLHRPHYHVLMFNVKDENNILRAWSDYELSPILQDDEVIYSDALTGSVDIGQVQDESIMYVTGYIGKRIGIGNTPGDDRIKEFSLMSKKLGLNYLDDTARFNKRNEETYVIIGGKTYALPRYLKEKIWEPTKIKPEYDRFDWAKLKPIVKKNHLLRKITKKNELRQIEAQNRDIMHFNSINDWEKNLRESAEIRNSLKQTIINDKI